jgi:hypothetical protein
MAWKQGFYPPMTINTPIRDVLAYMFAPPDSIVFVYTINGFLSAISPTFSSSDPGVFGQLRPRSSYTEWGDLAVRLEDENFRAEYVFKFLEQRLESCP